MPVALARPWVLLGGLCASLDKGSRSSAVTSQQKKPARGSKSTELLIQQSLTTFTSGAILGPLCDAQHSRYHVLQYTNPQTLKIVGLDYDIQTCWWVPLLFGVAGFIIGTGQPLLDNMLQKDEDVNRLEPSWGKVLLCISVFVMQYWASGFFGNSISNDLLLILLGITALAQWAVFDATTQGLLLAALTSLCGPLIEIALINVLHLYSYSKPSFFGIPAWIGAVYFCGGPAVGNLGRIVHQTLRRKQTGQ